MSYNIAISRIHFPVTTLGPGNRLGIWFQGCSIRCEGCISVDTWQHRSEKLTVADLISALLPHAQSADGVTISGGEPFEQPHALGELLAKLQSILNPGTDVLVYSGLPFASIAPRLEEWQGLVDALISEPFEVQTLQTRPLMGSDNQILHMLTPLGRQRFAQFQRPWDLRDHSLDLMVDEDGTAWMAGIPRRGDLERLRVLLTVQGTAVHTTEQKVR